MLPPWTEALLSPKVFVGMWAIVIIYIIYPFHDKIACFSNLRTRNALLNGNTLNYDWDNGYTCHQLGSGSILVQLGQPYIIDSMRYALQAERQCLISR